MQVNDYIKEGEEEVKDFYALLGVQRNATVKEINQAYRKLSKTMHPDISKEPNADEIFKEIVEAHKVLTDEDNRDAYDDFLKNYNKVMENKKSGKLLTFEDMYKKFRKKIKDVHEKVPGDSIEMKVIFRVEDLVRNKPLVVKFDRYENCGKCKGNGFNRMEADRCGKCTGKGYNLRTYKTLVGPMKVREACKDCSQKGYINRSTCDGCGGKGKVIKRVKLTASYPEDVVDGYRFVLHEAGDHGLNYGDKGHLILNFVQDKNDPYQIMEDRSLTTTISVPIEIAAKGGDFPVQLPSGEMIKMPIKPGTKRGAIYIEPDAGLPSERGKIGLLYIKLDYEVSDEMLRKISQLC